jgi:Protein of unknown function (DUF3485)
VRRAIPIFVFVALVVGAGAAHGLRTDRWSRSEDLRQAVAHLDRVPKQVGDWRGEDIEQNEDDAESMARAGILGHVQRRYVNRTTGQQLSVLLVCGRGGPISAHTPDVCYTGIGYKEVRAKQRVGLTAGPDKFWAAHFAKPNAVVPKRLEIYWAWSRPGAEWAAPDNERAAFARHPAVFKLYVVREAALATRPDDDGVRDFTARLLPELRTALTTE